MLPGMAAATLDLEIEQGTDYIWLLTLTSPDNGGQPLNLTGCALRGQVRSHHGVDAGLLYDLAAGGGLTITAPQAGQARLSVPGEASAAWGWSAAVYDIELVDSGGRPLRLLKGAVRVDPEVTR